MATFGLGGKAETDNARGSETCNNHDNHEGNHTNSNNQNSDAAPQAGGLASLDDLLRNSRTTEYDLGFSLDLFDPAHASSSPSTDGASPDHPEVDDPEDHDPDFDTHFDLELDGTDAEEDPAFAQNEEAFDDDDDEEDLLSNMTPISGLQNLSESIVVNGIHYAARNRSPPATHRRQRSTDRPHRPHQHPSRERSKDSASPDSPRTHSSRIRASRVNTSRSPHSRSRPIPIPDSPILKSKKKAMSMKHSTSRFSADRDFESFYLGGGRAVTEDKRGHAQGFHDFGNSYREHGQGFAFQMSL
mmetsp:Transcript_41115/g.60355  ORF Transcript_41115/g.60355 Transcript_41115/m.60355 type:complete len:301 (+) Transcript_41115:143-1045(+)